MKIEIKVLNKEFYKREKLGGEYYDLPDYQTFGSAAVDLCCTEDLTIYPGDVRLIGTGLAISINNPEVAAIILPRSGLGHTKGLVLGNLVGLIDEDYRGELKISAWNRKQAPGGHIDLKAGDRIAQLMFIPIIKAKWERVEEFSNHTNRGEGGFSSTGV